MDNIVCENCNTVYRFDASRIPPGGKKVRCGNCNHIFRVMPIVHEQDEEDAPSDDEDLDGDDDLDLEVEPELEQRTASSVRSTGSNAAREARKKRILLRQDGTRYAVADLSTLQRWIVERRVSRDAELSLDGEVWEKVAERMDLLPFFSIVDRSRSKRARKDRSNEPTSDISSSRLIEAARAELGGEGLDGAEQESLATQAMRVAVGPSADAQADAAASRAAESGSSRASAPAIAGGTGTVAPAAGSGRDAAPTSARSAGAAGAAVLNGGAAGTSLRAPVAAPATAPGGGTETLIKALYGLTALILVAAGGYALLQRSAHAPGEVAPAPVAARPASGDSPGGTGASSLAPGALGGAGTGTAVPPESSATSVPGASGSAPGIASNPTATAGSGGTDASAAHPGTATATGSPASAGARATPDIAEDPSAAHRTAGTTSPTTAAGTGSASTGASTPVSTVAASVATPRPVPVSSTQSRVAAANAEQVEVSKLNQSSSKLLRAGRSYLKEGRYSEAVSTLRQAAEQSPGNAVVHATLGDALHSLSTTEYLRENELRAEALQAYKRAIGANPSYGAAYYGAGVIQMETNQKEDAARSFRAALKHGLKDANYTSEVSAFLKRLEAQGYSGE